MDKGKPPWTLIISKKTGEWGMPYPGEQYDLGRTELGSDVVRPPVENFEIGCVDDKKRVGPSLCGCNRAPRSLMPRSWQRTLRKERPDSCSTRHRLKLFTGHLA